ncbi:hypothetical protein K3X44_05875 [Aliiroseovarius crassostreae]|uniref:response regulator receiver domain n=1 Tax=Aliiroseovarius crassostreae TaxID=154981 RepID=UPI0021F9CF52|nr:response regulator receiver domain [Aliiroseovarius crassostreae]UWQ02848.1 hypothetical protein K3X44_05875 [Aliiroseovarius crassostreae]
MTTNYTDLIREAFVAPLRSATIIDDEYPTWDHWLSGEAVWQEDGKIDGPKGEKKWESAKKIFGRIHELRGHKLIVDVHDGKSEADQIQNYHHSDLVILDYQLDGKDGDGSKSMKIAHQLLTQNDHFNLIVLHTQQDDDELITPFVDLLTRLMKTPDDINQKLIDAGDDLIEALDQKERINRAFGPQHYATVSDFGWGQFRAGLGDGSLANKFPIFSELNDIVTENGMKPPQVAQFTASLCDKLRRRYAAHFAEETAPGLAWTKGDNLWIKTNRGFIAFASKKSETNLIEILLDALTDWEPTPSRLISGKIRNLLHEQGSQLEDHFLQRDHVGWLFYRSLIAERAGPQSPAISSELGRQMERYSDLIREGITEFGARILETDVPVGEEGETKNGGMYCFDSAEEGIAHDQFNFFVSCKPQAGMHLAPGQILFERGNYWVVVSPSCDVVPGQKNLKTNTPGYMKFSAARLHPRSINEGRNGANTGIYIFLKHDDEEVKAFSIYGDTTGGVGERYLSQRTWLADNEGRFERKGSKVFLVARSESQDPVSQMLNFERVEFEVLNYQLRYEYALNLLSKVGSHASRVGLDFRSTDA